jgi:putative transposase
MEQYRTSAHTRFALKYHFVWTTKYRKPVLTGAVAARVRELVREVCRTNELEILQGHVAKDHVHVLISAPPNISPSKVMQYIKGKSSRKLLMEFRHLNREFWGRHLWARGFFVATSGNVTDEVVAEYIRLQGGEPPVDDTTFGIEHPG